MGAIEFIWNEIVKQVEQKQVSVLLITYDLNEACLLYTSRERPGARTSGPLS